MTIPFQRTSRNFLVDEYLPKIRLCVAPLTDDDIWGAVAKKKGIFKPK